MKRTNYYAVATAVALAAAVGLQGALAQDFPSRRMTLIVGYAAGGGVVDGSVRVLADKVQAKLGQPLIIDYRAGAQSQIAFEAVNKAPPDGYTLGFATIGLLTLPLNVKSYTLDPVTDLTPVALTSGPLYPMVLIGSPRAPFKTPAELVAYARANPGRVTIGAVGTSMEMEIALLGQRGGIQVTTVPYKGSPQMEGDVMAGDLTAGIVTYMTTKQRIDSGRLNLIGVGSRERTSNIPGVPALAESIPGYEITPFWFGVIAPPKTPANVVNRLSEAIVAGSSEPDVAPILEKLGLRPTPMNAAEFRAFLVKEKARFTEAANLINLKPQ